MCTPSSCSEHATCGDETGKPVCSCALGYAGEHCEACAPDHYRERRSNACVPFDCTVNPITSAATIDFDSWPGFPSSPDSCGASRFIGDDELTMLSIEGDGNVWSCAASTIYDLATPHIVLDAGNLGPAQLALSGQVAHLGFDYAAYSPLAITLFADGVEVGELNAAVGTTGRIDLDLRAPISLFELRSQLFTSEVALDNVTYSPPPCP